MKWWLMAAGAVALALLAWFFGQRGVNPMKAVRLALDITDAKTKAQKLAVNQGVSEARRMIEAEHKDTIERMNSEQKERAALLADDPAALAALLVKFGQGS